MPKTKKKWIDKKNSETYRLVYGSAKDNPIVDEAVGQQVSQPLKNVDEHIKCGIYFDDDYNYLQHLRSLNEFCESGDIERSIVKAPKGTAMLSNTLLEANNVEISMNHLSQGSCQGTNVALDPDIVKALDDDFDFDNLDEVLEDDFVLQANGGELPSQDVPKSLSDTLSMVQSKYGIRQIDVGGSESETESEQDSDTDERDFADDENNDEIPFVTSSAVNRPFGEDRFIDEKFDHLCDEYGKDEIDSEEEEEEKEEACLFEPDSHLMKDLVEEHRKNKNELILNDDEFTRRYAQLDDNDDQCERFEKISIECSGPKKAKWDCESVLTTYSNIYNRPTLITETVHKRRLKPVLNEMEKASTTRSVRSVSTVSTKRPIDETPENRKIRKAAVKASRAERRVEKKCNKLAFKEERRKFTDRRSHLQIRTVSIV